MKLFRHRSCKSLKNRLMEGYRFLKSNFSDTQDMNTDWSGTNAEKLNPFFQGGEEDGRFLKGQDLSDIIADALKMILYQKVHPNNISRKPDRNYVDNASFWSDALSSQHFPGTYVVLDDFHLLEWLPFSPGRYFTRKAEAQRKFAANEISRTRNEYLPNGKCSMVRGGIGTVRLAEKTIGGQKICFLGASSTGIAHQGIPIALPSEEYRKVMPIIRDRGGCGDERRRAVDWLLDYARRYSRDDPIVLTDFDEHYDFPCRVEFPISDIVRGTVDWKTLRVYKQHYQGTYIERLIQEFTTMEGDQFTVHGSGNVIVSRSTVQNAFNKVKTEYDEETANALKRVEEEINKSGNKEAAENFTAFSEELSKPEPKKSLLRTLWQGTLSALPTLAQMSSIVNLIVRLFA